MNRPYSENYRIYCEGIEKYAQQRLGRPLHPIERDGIWNAGSMMMLELVDRDVLLAADADGVAAELSACGRAFQARRRYMLDSGYTKLRAALHRPLTRRERAILEQARLDRAMALCEEVFAAPWFRRWGILRARLAEMKRLRV